MIYDDLMIFNSYVASGTVQQPSWKAMIIMNWELCSETYIYIYIHRDGFEHCSIAIQYSNRWKHQSTNNVVFTLAGLIAWCFKSSLGLSKIRVVLPSPT